MSHMPVILLKQTWGGCSLCCPWVLPRIRRKAGPWQPHSYVHIRPLLVLAKRVNNVGQSTGHLLAPKQSDPAQTLAHVSPKPVVGKGRERRLEGLAEARPSLTLKILNC